jgi:uncharacterized Zn-binding protein involved in type VI secretion
MPNAATEGSQTQHGGHFTRGSKKVKIDDHSAWRSTLVDYHICKRYKHYGGYVMNGGSNKVFIEFRRAVRVGDKVKEIGGGNNKIRKGNKKVIII